MGRPGLATPLAAALLVASSVGVSVALPGSEAEPRSRIIDRTLVCPALVHAGLRKIDAYAQEGVREDASTWRSLAAASVRTGSSGSGAFLAQAAAGSPIPHEWNGLGLFDTSLMIGSDCRPSTARVRLSSAGLVGGAADPFGDRAQCAPAPRRLIVRVRAVFNRPVSLVLDRRARTRWTRAHVKEAFIAVVTEAGRPLVFASVSDSSRARLFAAPACTSS